MKKYTKKYYVTKNNIKISNDGLWTYFDNENDDVKKKYTKDDEKFVFEDKGIVLLSYHKKVFDTQFVGGENLELIIYKSEKLYKGVDYKEVIKNVKPYFYSKNYHKNSIVAVLNNGDEVELVKGEKIYVDEPLKTPLITEANTDEYYSNFFD